MEIKFLIWFLLGIFSYFYFGYKTKWVGSKYNTNFDFFIEFIITSLCGGYSFFRIITYKYNKDGYL